MEKFITFLTVSRIIFAPLIFILIVFFQLFGFALLLFFFAAISDYLDGYFARKYDATSVIGEILDPISDKIIIIFLLFALAIELNSAFIAFVGALMISRDIKKKSSTDYGTHLKNVKTIKNPAPIFPAISLTKLIMNWP